MKIKRFKGDTIFYFVATVLFIALGVVLIVTDLGQDILNFLIALGILVYLFGYLFKKMKTAKRTILILTCIEFGMMFLIALGLLLSQFRVINVTGGCKIMGLAFALRGVVEMFRAYYHQAENNARYPLWQFIVNVVILVFGVYSFADPFITDSQMITVVTVLSFACALVCLALAFTCQNKDKKSIAKKAE